MSGEWQRSNQPLRQRARIGPAKHFVIRRLLWRRCLPASFESVDISNPVIDVQKPLRNVYFFAHEAYGEYNIEDLGHGTTTQLTY